MSEKHDPESTPLPAPLPGLSVEIEALYTSSFAEQAEENASLQKSSPDVAASQAHPATRAHADVAAHASDEKDPTDPELTPAAARSRSQLWWIIGGLALFALGIGAGALIWQPSVTVLPQAQIPRQVPSLPSLPSPPVEVTPIAPTQPTTVPTGPTEAPNVGPNAVPNAVPNGPPNVATNVAPTANPPGALPMIPNTPAPPVATPPPEAPVATPPPATPPAPIAVEPPAIATGPKPTRVVKPPVPVRPKPAPAPAPVVATKSKPVVEAPPPVAPPPPVPSGPQKQLSQATIRQLMLSSQSSWTSCVKDAFGSNLSIGIVVNGAGQVQKADILGPLAQSSTGRCITAEIRKLHFPPFTEGNSKQFFWSYQIPGN